ncbi:dockerin type I domain-containing protein [Novipirellula herctigrandis]|uniref:dockerin type I domain-containing protein n=1 Tax=Novipirellula herctigrandis TaxID=2527986 RepID=UPI003AF3FF9D
MTRRLIVERLDERRVLAAITGDVFHDLDLSFRQEPGEVALAKRLVYLDANDNGSLDRGEIFNVADDAGQFSFEDLADGSYLVRLFNGTETQQQVFPVRASSDADPIEVVDGNTFTLGANQTALVLTDTSIEVADFAEGAAKPISVDATLFKMQTLPNGKILVIGSVSEGSTSTDSAWLVDPSIGTVSPTDLSTDQTPTTWSDIAIDGDGNGVLVKSSTSPAPLLSIDASDSTSGIVVTETTTLVPAGTTVISSTTTPTSVVAWPGTSGLILSMWSNSTNSLLPGEPVEVAGTSDLVSFDDASDLLVLREKTGGITVVDTGAQFAPLHSFPEMTGPVAIDGARDMLLTVSPVDDVLRLIDLRDGSLIADLAIDLSSIGDVSGLATKGKPDVVTILGAAGIIEISLKQPDAHRVEIVDGQNVDSILFALSLDSQANTAPTFPDIPSYSIVEDESLSMAAPGTLNDVFDAEGDSVVVLQKSTAMNGTAELAVDGAIVFTPNDDFFGSETITIELHDGQNISEPFDITIDVIPVADPPTDIVIIADPVLENIDIGQPIGMIQVIDVDGIDVAGSGNNGGGNSAGGNHVIEINDPRFIIVDGQIIFVGGIGGGNNIDGLDYEQEYLIPLSITTTDLVTETVLVNSTALTVLDANDPITGISPTEASVFENAIGDIVTELLVDDQDTEQFHSFTVDDERFVIDGADLKLADDTSLDYEAGSEVVVNVTATEFGTGGTYTQAITIRVLDLPEQPQTLGLTGNTIVELKLAASVGDVTLDGSPASSRYNLTVDDPRFQIAGGTLSLADDEMVEQSTQSEIEVRITASDSLGAYNPISNTFVITVIENETPFHNPDNPYDVNGIGGVTAADALLIINLLNDFGPHEVGHGNPDYGYDVNGDGYVTALDALLVLNEVNNQGTGGGTVGGEQGEAPPEGEAIANEEPATPPQSDWIAADSIDNLKASEWVDPRDRAIIESTEPADGMRVVSDPQNSDDPNVRQFALEEAVGSAEDSLASTDSEALDETIRLLSDLS